MNRTVALLTLAVATALPTVVRAAAQAKPPPAKLRAWHGPYHGWDAAQFLGNGSVEVVIVPTIGRVMQFKFAADADGPFWENRTLDGKSPNAKTNLWGNFGGDKTWPAPQSEWSKLTPRAWPPPPAFDSMPAASLDIETTPEGPVAHLVSAVDPYFGIRTHRRISLDAVQPVLTIRTTYEKVSGEPSQVAIWIITQLKDPAGVFAPVPDHTIFPSRFSLPITNVPPSLVAARDLLSIRRDPTTAFKIGNDAGTLIWVGEKSVLRIDSPRVKGADYTHGGNSAEIYTNPDAAPYVELELLGPLHTLKVGEQIERTSTYTLSRRTQPTAEGEARLLLGRWLGK